MYSPIKNSNQYTLITGATSSIGLAIATRRASTDNLLLHGRDADSLADLAIKLNAITNVKVWCRDLTIADGLYEEFSQMLDKEAITIERVVHAAGYLKILPFRLFSLHETLKIFSINTFSLVEIIRVLTTKKHRDNLKSVVILSALFSKFGDKGNAIYSSSKGALNSLIKGLAVEYPHVRFNSLILGAVRTKMTEHLFDAGIDQARFARYVLGIGQVKQVSDAIDFLLNDSLWMTGQEVFLDGGASIS